MKTVTFDQFIQFGPCWLDEPGGRERLKHIAKRHKEWTAEDILRLRSVFAKDRLWAVLREEFIDAPIMHEFTCRCAEQALALTPNPDPRSTAAIEAKRKWIKGDITDKELGAAQAAAQEAAGAAFRDAAQEAAGAGAWAAAGDIAGAAAREAQVKMLLGLLGRGIARGKNAEVF